MSSEAQGAGKDWDMLYVFCFPVEDAEKIYADEWIAAYTNAFEGIRHAGIDLDEADGPYFFIGKTESGGAQIRASVYTRKAADQP